MPLVDERRTEGSHTNTLNANYVNLSRNIKRKEELKEVVKPSKEFKYIPFRVRKTTCENTQKPFLYLSL